MCVCVYIRATGQVVRVTSKAGKRRREERGVCWCQCAGVNWETVATWNGVGEGVWVVTETVGDTTVARN